MERSLLAVLLCIAAASVVHALGGSAAYSSDAVMREASAEYEALAQAERDADALDAEEMAANGETDELSAEDVEHGLAALEEADAEDDAVELEVDEADESDESGADVDAESTDEDANEDLELMELETRFGPFQAAANVMPYNMAVDPGHNFMNPFIRGYNPAYDGYTPQPGGMHWNNPNGPYWSPFHWSAPANYWSVYPPQYASHYVDPHMYHAPGLHQFFGPNSYGGHAHAHGPHAAYPYGQTSMDPHVYGPHLDWPFGALTSDMDHVPGMGTGVNPLQRFPQFVETGAAAKVDAPAAACQNCAYRD